MANPLAFNVSHGGDMPTPNNPFGTIGASNPIAPMPAPPAPPPATPLQATQPTAAPMVPQPGQTSPAASGGDTSPPFYSYLPQGGLLGMVRSGLEQGPKQKLANDFKGFLAQGMPVQAAAMKTYEQNTQIIMADPEAANSFAQMVTAMAKPTLQQRSVKGPGGSDTEESIDPQTGQVVSSQNFPGTLDHDGSVSQLDITPGANGEPGKVVMTPIGRIGPADKIEVTRGGVILKINQDTNEVTKIADFSRNRPSTPEEAKLATLLKMPGMDPNLAVDLTYGLIHVENTPNGPMIVNVRTGKSTPASPQEAQAVNNATGAGASGGDPNSPTFGLGTVPLETLAGNASGPQNSIEAGVSHVAGLGQSGTSPVLNQPIVHSRDLVSQFVVTAKQAFAQLRANGGMTATELAKVEDLLPNDSFFEPANHNAQKAGLLRTTLNQMLVQRQAQLKAARTTSEKTRLGTAIDGLQTVISQLGPDPKTYNATAPGQPGAVPQPNATTGQPQGAPSPLAPQAAGTTQDNPLGKMTPQQAAQLPPNTWFTTTDGRVLRTKQKGQ